ncbi:MAG TPA: flagellar basal body-associated FliL family protein [Devosia sp.]|jgi:flagellar FliL protein|uniref:flagellar basal body-associated FliL family protein n=1 Tax=Devosia sp. TaxID=1871048 RepID=UPI002F93F663
MAAEAEVEDGAPAKKGIPKLFIIIGAAAIVVLLGGAGLFMFLSSGSAPAEGEHAAEGADGHAAAGADGHGAEAAHTFIFNLPTMVVNLNNSEGGAGAFMKLTVALEVANEEMMVEIQPRIAKVVDAFQVYLRELRRSDLEGSAGVYRLKEELLRRVNVAIYPSQVESILFKELLVQ